MKYEFNTMHCLGEFSWSYEMIQIQYWHFRNILEKDKVGSNIANTDIAIDFRIHLYNTTRIGVQQMIAVEMYVNYSND